MHGSSNRAIALGHKFERVYAYDIYLVGRGLQVLDAAQEKVGGSLVFLQEVVVSCTTGNSGSDQKSENAIKRQRNERTVDQSMTTVVRLQSFGGSCGSIHDTHSQTQLKPLHPASQIVVNRLHLLA